MSKPSLFSPGSKISLRQGAARIESRVRGYKAGELILVDTPDQIGVTFDEGAIECELHRRTGSPVTFSSRFSGELPDFALSLIAYPEAIEGLDEGGTTRLNVNLPVRIVAPGGGQDLKGVMTDISLEGCQIKCEQLLVAGDGVVIKGALPGVGEPFELAGLVRVAMKMADGGGAHGVEFDADDTENLDRLKDYHAKIGASLGA